MSGESALNSHSSLKPSPNRHLSCHRTEINKGESKLCVCIIESKLQMQ
jgi:hypothetical protein